MVMKDIPIVSWYALLRIVVEARLLPQATPRPVANASAPTRGEALNATNAPLTLIPHRTVERARRDTQTTPIAAWPALMPIAAATLPRLAAMRLPVAPATVFCHSLAPPANLALIITTAATGASHVRLGM